jgi:23S rRNA (cytidine1920-2'-O)/16S rRNA (cytidine1409-2'-O)-methyltransferase
LDKKAIANAMIKFEDACRLYEWQLVEKLPSRLTGKEGNLEYCYYFKK